MSTSSIEVPTNIRCAFCDYLAGVRPYTVLRKGELSAILVTREQRGRSHVLVVPTRHRPTILDLPADEACAVMRDVDEVSLAETDEIGRRLRLALGEQPNH